MSALAIETASHATIQAMTKIEVRTAASAMRSVKSDSGTVPAPCVGVSLCFVVQEGSAKKLSVSSLLSVEGYAERDNV